MKSSEKIKGAESVPRVLTAREVSEYLRIRPATVYRLLRSRQLPGFRVGGEWRFLGEAIDRFAAEESRSAVAQRRPRSM